MNKMTLSVIKADVGSDGGHTQPTAEMLDAVEGKLLGARQAGTLTDCRVFHTGDDILQLMVHALGKNDPTIHRLAWDGFQDATAVARAQGLYGAGQDLLVDAPSHNLRGAGPAVAEVTFEFGADGRGAEPFLVFAADKCGPGMYSFPIFSVFANPMFCAGLMLPKMIGGFRFRLLDMDHPGADRVITLDAPERLHHLAILLRDEHRYGIAEVWSRRYPEQQAVAISAHRLHTVAGKYTGKDDPVALVRTQGFFPAPEEAVSPYLVAPFVGGDARGSHNMPLMPVALNTAVTGAYCLPLVSCVAFSVNADGTLSAGVDVFGNPAWDETRHLAQVKGAMMRQQGFFGPAMLPTSELEYAEYRDVLADLQKEFIVAEE